eukprot:2557245-Rhodomonas_salina.2
MSLLVNILCLSRPLSLFAPSLRPRSSSLPRARLLTFRFSGTASPPPSPPCRVFLSSLAATASACSHTHDPACTTHVTKYAQHTCAVYNTRDPACTTHVTQQAQDT